MSLSKKSRLGIKNGILAALPPEEYELLLPHLEPVYLPTGKTIYHAADTIRHSYFLTGGMISLLSVTAEGRCIEVGMVGSEGVIGVPVVLGTSTTAYQVMVQLPADALRIRSETLRAEFVRNSHLRALVLRYLNVLLVQISQSATCNRFHTMEQRLCRWLLVSYDRVHTSTINLTQEFLSHMIGAPRTRITLVAVRLQREGVISYSRGKIVILDRKRLESFSCECYRIVRDQVGHSLAA